MISSKTSFLALIGNPITHSLSPIMQNAALKYLGLDLIYIAIPCKEEDFRLVINSLKKINCVGLNITIPYKEKVFDLCKDVTPIAKKLKAINTIKLNLNNEWSATNTDVDGFIYPLNVIQFTKKESLILGSGGAARAAIQGLINLKFSKITIISRNQYSLNRLIEDFPNQTQIQGLLNIDSKVNDLIENADLIVNTTPVGMKTQKDEGEIYHLEKTFGNHLTRKLPFTI